MSKRLPKVNSADTIHGTWTVVFIANLGQVTTNIPKTFELNNRKFYTKCVNFKIGEILGEVRPTILSECLTVEKHNYLSVVFLQFRTQCVMLSSLLTHDIYLVKYKNTNTKKLRNMFKVNNKTTTTLLTYMNVEYLKCHHGHHGLMIQLLTLNR